jgi:hypothetical protein
VMTATFPLRSNSFMSRFPQMHGRARQTGPGAPFMQSGTAPVLQEGPTVQQG